MPVLVKSELKYTYSWTAIGNADPKVSGEPDSTLLNRNEGYEVLYLINKLADRWGFEDKEDGLRIEHLIHSAPNSSHSQEKIKAWVLSNWSIK